MVATKTALLGLLALLGLAVPAGATEPDPPLGEGNLELPWAIIGTKPDRKSLLLASTSGVDSCRVTHVDTLPANEGEIRLRLVSRYRDPSKFCLPNDADFGVVRERVKVTVPLRGQPISGPQMVTPSAVFRYLKDRGDGDPVYPVVGLRTALAKDILRAAGFKRRDLHINHRGNDHYVTSTSPKLPKVIKRSFPVTLTTR